MPYVYIHPMMYGWTGWWGGLMPILMWVVLIIIAILFVRFVAGSGSNWRMRDYRNNLDIIKERYARGEIDKAQYEAMKRDLEEK